MAVYNLAYDIGMRHIFEYVSKILLKRTKQDAFVCRQFNSLEELESKYNLRWSTEQINIRELLNNNWNKCDIIRFELEITEDENTCKRIKRITSVELFEVKTKWHSVNRNYYEFCKSNYDFLNRASSKYNIPCTIISILLKKDWFYTVNFYKFEDVPKHIYKYQPKRTKPYYFPSKKKEESY